MDVTSINSMTNSLADLASNMASGNIQNQLATAILRQALEQQRIQAQGLLKMINATASLCGTGQVIDLQA